jgi:hypothetical protein
MVKLEIAAWQAGHYLLRIEGEEQVLTERFFVLK